MCDIARHSHLSLYTAKLVSECTDDDNMMMMLSRHNDNDSAAAETNGYASLL